MRTACQCSTIVYMEDVRMVEWIDTHITSVLSCISQMCCLKCCFDIKN